MHTCRLKAAFHTRFVKHLMSVKIATFCPKIPLTILYTLNAYMST